MLKTDPSNIAFQLAADMVNHTSQHIFLTGKAGTGKTTFLKYIRETCPKQMAVIAPTGVAAINAGGVTIHSFFQLPLSPFIPENTHLKGLDINDRHTLLGKLRFNREKLKVLQGLDLLIIDEVSMVRCDIIDAIDLVLRHVRGKHNEKFGGVQLLFIGDMFQLPPVVREQEWSLLRSYYKSPYFFDSMVLKESPPLYVEFTRIYRQAEEKFITLLNQIRNNELTAVGRKILEERFDPDFHEYSNDHIILTTHNEKARNINARELDKINKPLFTYKAELRDDFPLSSSPAEELLQLKMGARVMFIKNDTDKRYFNGKIGTVVDLEKDKIYVECEDDPSPIEVTKEKWENIRYTMNSSSRQLEEELLGSCTQYPLRLAWAITIHKSQGLTFEKAIIDAGEAFAPGQVYVALSRCTSLQGLVLHNQLREASFNTDERIVRFSRNAPSLDNLKEELTIAKKGYEQKVLISLFDLTKVVASIKEAKEYLAENISSFENMESPWIDIILSATTALQDTALKFQSQLGALFSEADASNGNNGRVQERLKAAAAYFIKEINGLTENILRNPLITDSRIHAKECNEFLKEIFAQLALKKHLLQSANNHFTLELYYKQRKNFVLPSVSINVYAGKKETKTDVPHPQLHHRLRKLRDTICSKKDLPIYMVASSKTLDEMATCLPQTKEELIQISGFGKSKLASYGNQFLEIIKEYCQEHDLESSMPEKSSRKSREKSVRSPARKTDMKEETYQLFKEGFSPAIIAKTRNLSLSTIETHLAWSVGNGRISVEELIDPEKLKRITPILSCIRKEPLSSIKQKLGDDISWAEIHYLIAWFENQDVHTASQA